jgi:CubicO group peptidase (beta-lactamase class C family)
LLSHTSGYRGANVADPAIRYFFSWPKFLDLLAGGGRLFRPGSVFNYEHTECVLLGQVLERVTGHSILSLFQSVIFEPLRITAGQIGADARDRTFHEPDHAFDPATRQYKPLRTPPSSPFWQASLSDLTMSLADMLTLGEAIAGWGPRQVFSCNAIGMLRELQIALPPAFGPSEHERIPNGFGRGLARYESGLWGHNGSARGQTCALRIAPEANMALVVALNAWRPYARDLLVEKIFASSLAGPPSSQPPQRADAAAWNFEELAGRYLGAVGSAVQVSHDGKALTCSARVTESASQEMRIVLTRTSSGSLHVEAPASHVTVGFFPNPGGCSHNLMIGLNSYARESDAL